MANRNLFQKLNNPSSDIPLKPFDLSRRIIYSSRPGICDIELAMEVVKGDKFKIDTTVFNRTDKLLAPAFIRLKQFHHFFFVPYNTLWHEWDNFFTRSTEKESAATLGNSYFPNFSVYDYLNHITSLNSNNRDMMNLAKLPGIDRNMQKLGYGCIDCFNQEVFDAGNLSGKYMNLARILAYNKIWYWFYRDKRHRPAESNTWWNNFVKYYNVDDIDCSTFDTSHVLDFDRIDRMFEIKYRTWDSDLFTNSFASTQFGSVSVLNAENVQIKNSVLSTGSDLPGNNVTVVSGSGGANLAVRDSNGNVFTGSSRWNINSLFDILTLRRAEAVQHWRELMLRAGDSSKDRYRAMFGTSPKRSDEIPTYIGGFDVNLNVDDVTATAYSNSQASGDTNGLGQLAGKGIMSSDGNHIEFTAPDYGIVMCISSILPLTEYDGNQFDKANMLVEPTDFYIPQFDRLGFEPVIRAELNAPVNIWPYLNTVVGYTVRNHYLKTSVDRVYNNFRHNKADSYWAFTRDTPYTISIISGQTNFYQTFYVSPTSTNHLFDRQVVPTTNDPDASYLEDPFKCLTYFDIKALRPMSQLGLPPL